MASTPQLAAPRERCGEGSCHWRVRGVKYSHPLHDGAVIDDTFRVPKRMSSPTQITRAIVLTALAMLGAPARAQSSDETLHTFYSWVLAHPSRGLPSPAERAELAKVLSPALIESLKTASETEARCVEAAPKGDKPYIVEGDLFVG